MKVTLKNTSVNIPVENFLPGDMFEKDKKEFIISDKLGFTEYSLGLIKDIYNALQNDPFCDCPDGKATLEKLCNTFELASYLQFSNVLKKLDEFIVARACQISMYPRKTDLRFNTYLLNLLEHGFIIKAMPIHTINKRCIFDQKSLEEEAYDIDLKDFWKYVRDFSLKYFMEDLRYLAEFHMKFTNWEKLPEKNWSVISSIRGYLVPYTYTNKSSNIGSYVSRVHTNTIYGKHNVDKDDVINTHKKVFKYDFNHVINITKKVVDKYPKLSELAGNNFIPLMDFWE